MELRCKACDIKLTGDDFFIKKHEDTDEDEDLCSTCRDVVFSGDDIDTREYAFEDLTEITNIIRKSLYKA